jgi:hypothetical protein
MLPNEVPVSLATGFADPQDMPAGYSTHYVARGCTRPGIRERWL